MRRFSYANVMSTLAVFLALAGGSFAIGVAVKKNSVKSKQVKDNALKSKDLRNGKAVTGADVADGSLAGADVADRSIAAADLAADEAPHVVGSSGEPVFLNGGDGDCTWDDYGLVVGGLSPVSFYKGSDGRVQLGGTIRGRDTAGGDGVCDNSPAGEAIQDMHMFTLPPGYRPAASELHMTTAGGGLVFLLIGAEENARISSTDIPEGAVIVFGFTSAIPSGLALDGISFRSAAGPPTSSAPAQGGGARRLLGETLP